MTVFRGTQDYATSPLPGATLTIGNFDGVHRGHRHLIDAARAEPGPTVALTFDPAPRDVLHPDHGVLRIQTLDDRLRCLADAGVDAVIVEPFTLELAAMEPIDFAQQILRDRLHPSSLVLGYDFRYGRKRAGTVDMLRDWLAMPIHQVDALHDADGPVSSSRIREAVACADLALATRLLGRPHELVGTVVHGEARGRQLGFPTANFVPLTSLRPPHGVYAIRALVDGTWQPGVANWGRRPMWATDTPLFEAHLLDFDGDLYDRDLRVQLIAHLRPEARFDGPEQLKAAIAADIAAARALL
jgi:riboflavin kinase / FMN adenylyltransferase